jgi:hypothetical protein
MSKWPFKEKALRRIEEARESGALSSLPPEMLQFLLLPPGRGWRQRPLGIAAPEDKIVSFNGSKDYATQRYCKGR